MALGVFQEKRVLRQYGSAPSADGRALKYRYPGGRPGGI